ncbi:MAG: patatin [Alphaproteobacteria bacterium]|jgi:predicted acylesterase/phospholipase RssA|nr:patatin [Alphaproteobacteria bacterium]MDF3033142.1 patatin [Alphaproteobacteria bacterium]
MKALGRHLFILISCFMNCTSSFSREVLPKVSLIEKKSSQPSSQPQKKLIKILSIDGGGIRGIIPALVLKSLEEKLKNKKHLAECFDVMAGTSTGGIIILFLNAPGPDGKPKFNASELVKVYQNFGRKVFYQSIWHSIKTLNGWIGEKYSTQNLEETLQDYFGDTRLRHSFTNILISAYDISKDNNVFFKTNKARLDLGRDFYFRHIARATSAAPTYFKPAKITDLGEKEVYDLIDGGIAMNNPTLSACVHALELFGKDNDFLIVSLGTGSNYGAPKGKLAYGEKKIPQGGKLGWVEAIVPLMMYADNDLVDYQMNQIFDGQHSYYRFQTLIEARHAEMDNVDPRNIRDLQDYAHHLIKENNQDLEDIARILDRD